MNKSLTITTQFDTKDFDRSVREMQQKLGRLQPSSDFMKSATEAQLRHMQSTLGWGGSNTSPREQHRLIQQARSENARLAQDEMKQLGAKNKLLKEQENSLERLKDLKNDQYALDRIGRQNDYDMGQKGVDQTKKEIGLLQDKIKARQQYEKDVRAIEKEILTKRIATVGAMVAGGLAVGAELYRAVQEAPLNARVAQGAAVKNVLGAKIGMMQTPYGQAWIGETSKAAREAERWDQAERVSDKLLAAAAGSAIGAGLVAGGIPGLALAGGGGAKFLSSSTLRPLALGRAAGWAAQRMGEAGGGAATDYLRQVSRQQMEEYEAERGRLRSEQFLKYLTAEQDINPSKDIAAKRYSAMYMQYLQSQQGMGLGYGGFHGPGGFLGATRGAGFTEEMGMGMSGQILQAGGSARMARQAPWALQMQRNNNLTNAGQVLGMLSGSLGSSSASEDALVKILAKGTEQGLDNSDYADVQRKFAETTADLIGKSGALTPADIQMITNLIGGGLAQKTTVGVGAARTAYENIMGAYTATGGWQSVLEESAMAKRPEFRKLGPMFKYQYESLNPTDFEPGGKAEALASQMGISIDRLRELKFGPGGTAQEKLSRFGKFDTARRKLWRTGGRARPSTEEMGRLKRTNPQEWQAWQDLAQFAPPGLHGADYQSYMQEVLTKPATAAELKRQSGMYGPSEALRDKGTGIEEWKTVADLAEGQRVAAEGLKQFKDEIILAPTAAHNFVQSLIDLSKSVSTAAGKIALLKVFEGVTGTSTDNQQATPSSNTPQSQPSRD